MKLIGPMHKRCYRNDIYPLYLIFKWKISLIFYLSRFFFYFPTEPQNALWSRSRLEIFPFAKCNVYFAYHCINKTQNRCRKSWVGHSSIRLLWIWYNLIMFQAKFGHFHRLLKQPSADIYKCVTYIRTVPEFVHSINFFFFSHFFQKNTQQDWVTLMKAHNGRFLGNSVNGSKTICIKTGFHPRICIISVDNCYLKNTSKVMLYVWNTNMTKKSY